MKIIQNVKFLTVPQFCPTESDFLDILPLAPRNEMKLNIWIKLELVIAFELIVLIKIFLLKYLN